MLKTALLILTLGQNGTVHMALSEAETLADCEGMAESVEQILTSAGYKIQALRCGQTDLDLTPYEHGHTPDDVRWHYHVVVEGTALHDGFTVRSMSPGTCATDGDASAYCAISAQGPVTE